MYQVEGYAFETKEQEHTAKHEVEIIGYIRKNTRMDDPDIVLALYNKLVLKEIFVTPVGYDFLHRLQEYLYTIPYIRREDILPITVYEPEGMVSKEKRSKEEIKQKKKRQKNKEHVVSKNRRKKNRDYQKLFHISTFFAVVFALGIIGMLVITWLSEDNVTILNYENKVIDKYEIWEKQLDERESQLEERELRLTEQEADFLTRQNYEVLEAADGEEALDIFYKDKAIALLILDVMMPKMNGWEVCREIRQTSKVPIIMLTAKSDESDELMGFDLGVDEYITKPFSPKILVARVEAILRRTNKIGDAADLKTAGEIILDKTAHEVKISGNPVELSFKEFELLEYFMNNQGIARSRERILNRVRNYAYFGDARTIDTHVKKLRNKLGACGSYIKTVWGMGYKFEVS